MPPLKCGPCSRAVGHKEVGMEFSKMGFESKFVGDVTLRLKRVEGQIRALREMIGAGDRDCEEILQQLSAATRALDRVTMLLLTTGMQICLRKEMEGKRGDGYSMEKIQKMFMRLR